jgi:SSS family solute:Na+ symporter
VVFGVALYAVFTFVWTPVHYIHLMLVTLIACLGVGLGVNRFLLGGRASLGLFRAV